MGRPSANGDALENAVEIFQRIMPICLGCLYKGVRNRVCGRSVVRLAEHLILPSYPGCHVWHKVSKL